MPYSIEMPTNEKKEIYVDLDPEYSGPREGPGELNGFMGKESLIQIETNQVGLVVGVRIRLEIGRDDSSYINDVAPRLN